MTIRALSKVSFHDALGIDRYDTRLDTAIQTTAIASDIVHLEADIHQGRIGDVHIYLHVKATLDQPAKWVWYTAVPTANIKAYMLAGDLPSPSALPTDEPKASPPSPVRAA